LNARLACAITGWSPCSSNSCWQNARAKKPRLSGLRSTSITNAPLSLVSEKIICASKGWVGNLMGSCDDHLAAVEGLCVGRRRLALHPAKPEQAREQVLLEPRLRALGGEVVEQVVDLLPADVGRQRDEHVR